MSKKVKWIIGIIVALAIIGALYSNNDKDQDPKQDVVEQKQDVAENGEEKVDTEVKEKVDTEVKEDEKEEIVLDSGTTFTLNQTISYDDFDITFTKIEKVKDYEGKPVLKLTYNWTNKAEKPASPFMTFSLKGFQDGVETESFFMSDSIDLGKGQKEVKPGATIENCEEGIMIEDESKPLDLELKELIAFNGVTYTMTVNPSDY